MRVDETNLQFRIGFLIIVLDVDLLLGVTYRRKALSLGRDLHFNINGRRAEIRQVTTYFVYTNFFYRVVTQNCSL